MVLLISWILVAPFLANLAFDGFPVPPLFEDIGVFAASGSVVFVSALNAYTRGGLVASFAVGLTPSLGLAVVGLFTGVLGITDGLGDGFLWTFVFLLLPLLTQPLALAGFVLGVGTRFAVNAVID